MSPVSGLHRVPSSCSMGEEEARVMMVWVPWVQPHQTCVLKACEYSFLPHQLSSGPGDEGREGQLVVCINHG